MKESTGSNNKETLNNYTWNFTDEFLTIIDLNVEKKSIVNNMNNILSDIRPKIEDKINDVMIIYKNNEGIWKIIDATWNEEGKCIDVKFKPYIR